LSKLDVQQAPHRSTQFRESTEIDFTALVNRWFEEVWNLKNEEVIFELMAPDAVAFGIGDLPVDRDGFRKGWVSFIETFPDVRVSVDDVVAQGNKTAVRLTVTGTHAGAGLGVEPSGKFLTFQAHSMCEWENGRIIRGWNVIDMVAAYRQIGANGP
jgi:predicted ester cyclase